MLNSEGPFRRAKEWPKFWNDYKTRVRGKLIHNGKSQMGTGGGPSTTIVLTPIEQRAAFIIGQDVGLIPGVQQNPFQFNEVEANEIQQHVQTESSSSVLDTATQDELRNEFAPALELQFSVPASISAHHAPPSVLASSPENASHTLSSHILANARMRSRNPTARRRPPPVQQSNRGALEESRSAIVKMEVMRARTEELLAQSLLKQTEAAERHGRAIEKMAQSFEVIAEAVARMSRRRRRSRVSSSDNETVLLDYIP